MVRSARLRPVRSALSRLSAADQRSVRCDLALNPALGGPCRRLSARRQSLKLPGSRLRRPVRDPRLPHPGPPLSSRRGDRRLGHICPRVRCAEIFRKKSERWGPSDPAGGTDPYVDRSERVPFPLDGVEGNRRLGSLYGSPQGESDDQT